MENKFLLISEKQKEAYLLREQNLSFPQIAEQLGISPSAARERYRNALRGIRKCEAQAKAWERNNVPGSFPVTRGELLMIGVGLEMLTRSSYLGSRGEAQKSYERVMVEQMLERVETVLRESKKTL